MNGLATPSPIGSILDAFVWLGRRAMDFGFGAFLEKFEQHYGAGITRVLLALMGLAVAVFACAMIWTQAIRPAITEIDTIAPNRADWDHFIRVLWSATAVGASVGTALLFLAGGRAVLLGRKYDRLVARAEAVIERGQKLTNNAKQTVAVLDLALDEVLKTSVESGQISGEKADLIRSLLDTALERRP